MMAEAIMRGILSKNVIAPSKISVCEVVEQRRTELARLGVHVTPTPAEMLGRAEIVIIAVKPDIVPIVLDAIGDHEENPEATRAKQLFISICAGVTLDTLEDFNTKRKCVRVMPNQPCVVGEAASAFAMNANCHVEDKHLVNLLMGACGLVEEVPEKHMDAVTGLSGSGPAYAFMMIEAMADGGVRMGLPRHTAKKLAAQTLLGAAKMVLETGLHPAELRNRVESPGGTTTAATATLESGGFRGAVINAVSRATERSEQLGKKA